MPNKIKNKDSERTNLKDVFSDPSQHNTFARNLTSIDDHTYEQLKMCRITEVITHFSISPSSFIDPLICPTG